MNYLTFERNNKPKLVHRLDRETSGLILLARHDQSARDITALFRNRNITKYYLAICSGQPKIAQGTIKVALPNNLMQNPNNLPTTHYKLLSSHGSYALMQFEIETGKKHQIRIHSAGLGLPILGDVKYGGKPATRLFLHSHEMIFELNNQKFHIKAPISTTFKQMLSRLNLMYQAN
jgi:23S rRNA-/tRNA-specific pseudouridylate synthase